eukprot:scaffold264_cov317-Pinguiococcus_pyrenoidosus.AAC.2
MYAVADQLAYVAEIPHGGTLVKPGDPFGSIAGLVRVRRAQVRTPHSASFRCRRCSRHRHPHSLLRSVVLCPAPCPPCSQQCSHIAPQVANRPSSSASLLRPAYSLHVASAQLLPALPRLRVRSPGTLSPCFAVLRHASPRFRCLHLPPPGSTWLHLPPPASTCLHLPPPASTCLHLPPPASTCLHLAPPASTCNLLLVAALRSRLLDPAPPPPQGAAPSGSGTRLQAGFFGPRRRRDEQRQSRRDEKGNADAEGEAEAEGKDQDHGKRRARKRKI